MTTEPRALHTGVSAFQRRQWRLQRVGWAIALTLVIGGVLGVFGDGPLSSAEATSSNGAHRMTYERFLRRQAPSRIELHLSTPVPVVRFDRGYARDAWLRPLAPTPVQARSDGDALIYRFAGPAAAQTLSFSVEPVTARLLRARIALGDGSVIAFWQLVYP